MLLVVLAGACRHGARDAPAAARTPTPLDTASTGTITGTVRHDGPLPPLRAVLALARDPTCDAAHPGGLEVRDVEGDDGGLADAFVYIAQGLEKRVFAVPERPVVIDQRGCLYEPRVAGAQVGQRIEFVNSDDTLHNVHGEPTASQPWNFGLGVVGARRTIVIDHAEVPVPVRCDVHPWMRADLGVVDHPYFAVAGRAGTFTLGNVPAGSYVVAAWHPRLGRRERAVEVSAGETSVIDFAFGAE